MTVGRNSGRRTTEHVRKMRKSEVLWKFGTNEDVKCKLQEEKKIMTERENYDRNREIMKETGKLCLKK